MRLCRTIVARGKSLSVLAAVCLVLGACHSQPTSSTPALAFSKVPQSDPEARNKNDTVEGHATGVRPGQQIILYIKRDGRWGLQRSSGQPFTKIANNGRWSSSTDLGTEYASPSPLRHRDNRNSQIAQLLNVDNAIGKTATGEEAMPTITTKDGTQIYYKDWGKGQPIVFSHGWPLTADDWDGQMLYFGQHGHRVIAHDRRGHGRSTQTWDGNEMDTYADDLATLSEKLDLKNAIHVGHSTGGGEVARYIGRHGTKRVAMAVLISAVPPLMLKTEKNPGGLPLSVFDGLRAQLVADRAQFYKDITLPFYGYNRPGAKISEGVREHWWLQGMMGGVKAHYDCIKAFSETDFTEDLKKIDVPTLIMHGDDDQIVPIGAAALMSSKIVKNAKLKVYQGFPHGMPTTNADQINFDLLMFIQQTKQAAA